jgi:peptide/nickel transport system substrate-binding protein
MAATDVDRINRRRAITAGLGGGVAAVLAACGGSDKDDKEGAKATAAPTTAPAAGAAPAQGKVGGTARYPLAGVASGEPPTIFPFENLSYLSQHPSALHYSRLLRSVSAPDIAIGDHTRLEGDVAAKLPEQPDPLTYIFQMKPNVRFHDKPPLNGRAATARDFLQTWDYFKTKSQNAASFSGVIDRVEAPDEKTIKVTLKDAFSPFLVTHASSAEGIWFIPAETIESGQAQKDPVGTGPWIFRQWESSVAIRWDRNPQYFDGPMPYFAKVEASLINDPARIIASLQTGALDLWGPMSSASGAAYDEAHKKLDPKGTEYFESNPALSGIYFNFDNKPWGDKRMRQALSMLLDRDGYLRVQDQTRKGDYHSHISPAYPPFYMSPKNNEADYGPNAKYFKRDPAEAKKLMAAAGFPEGLSFKMFSSFDTYGAVWKQNNELISSTILEHGLKAEIVFQPYASYIQSTYLGKFNEGIALGPFIGAARDPDDIFFRVYASVSPRHNWGGTPIPEMADLDARFVKQRKILDTQERVQEIREIQRVMAESMLMVPVHAAAYFGYAQPWLQNLNWKSGYGIHTEAYAKAWFTDERIRKG